MNTDHDNEYLVTGDVDGIAKTWVISDYCLRNPEGILITDPPCESSNTVFMQCML